MQEHNFIPSVGVKSSDFWQEAEDLAKKHEGDQILMYMGLMLEKARQAKKPVHREDFQKHGKTIELFDGVDTWFDRITSYGKAQKVNVEHYLISSGNAEIIMGTPIHKFFKRIYASKYAFNENDVADWPALAINYTTKTQYLFRINKGYLDLTDDKNINKYVAKSKRPVPFENIIYLGDGPTDVPCFRLVKDQGGLSIAVYRPRHSKAKAEQCKKDGRVDVVVPADYQEGNKLDTVIKARIDLVSATKKFTSEL